MPCSGLPRPACPVLKGVPSAFCGVWASSETRGHTPGGCALALAGLPLLLPTETAPSELEARLLGRSGPPWQPPTHACPDPIGDRIGEGSVRAPTAHSWPAASSGSLPGCLASDLGSAGSPWGPVWCSPCRGMPAGPGGSVYRWGMRVQKQITVCVPGMWVKPQSQAREPYRNAVPLEVPLLGQRQKGKRHGGPEGFCGRWSEPDEGGSPGWSCPWAVSAAPVCVPSHKLLRPGERGLPA